MNSIGSTRRVRRHRLLTTVCLVAVTSMIAAACGGAPEDGARDDGSGPFIVYASLGVSGADSTFAPAIKAGLEAAITEINDRGGLLGREVRLEQDNNESDPTKAVSLLQNRIRETPPNLVWAGTSSSESLAMQGLTTRAKVMSLNNGSATELGDAGTFPYSFTAGVRFQAVADYLSAYLKDKGYKKVGVLAGDDPAGEAAAKLYRETFEPAGLEVFTESYESGAVEVDGPLARLGADKPDVVVFNTTYHAEPILKSRVKVGMGTVPFVGDVSTTVRSVDQTLNEAEKAGVELTTYDVNSSTTDRPGVDNLIESLNAAGVQYTTALLMYALAYDPVLAYANAVESVGSTDVDKVRAAMEADAGDTYQLSLADDLGWTDTDHLSSGEGRFLTIPVAQLVAGRFQFGN
ncbi:ABC transporter substrate-binding protein [Nocardia sp. NPDC019395]|uniref:ABC transporter substrate-binding protein n=1 Tax=Nocardia sp. NPDC019395 TaxID=3154686 RepID=UPI0033ED3EF2